MTERYGDFIEGDAGFIKQLAELIQLQTTLTIEQLMRDDKIDSCQKIKLSWVVEAAKEPQC